MTDLTPEDEAELASLEAQWREEIYKMEQQMMEGDDSDIYTIKVQEDKWGQVKMLKQNSTIFLHSMEKMKLSMTN